MLWDTLPSFTTRSCTRSTLMATTCRIGLNLPVRQFPERAFDALRGYLDKEDETGTCDWRTLVTKLQLNEEQIESVRTSENKSKTALLFWQQNESVEDRNGRELVRVLYDMGRRDCAREIERFLGQRYKPESWQYMDILEAARMGDVNELAELIGDKTVSLGIGITCTCLEYLAVGR